MLIEENFDIAQISGCCITHVNDLGHCCNEEYEILVLDQKFIVFEVFNTRLIGEGVRVETTARFTYVVVKHINHTNGE